MIPRTVRRTVPANVAAASLLALALVLPPTAGCKLGPGLLETEIEVTGARQTLEEQVLGAFTQQRDEVYALAGVRSVDPVTGAPRPPPPATASKAEVLKARRRMEFNRDDVLAFKRAGYVGEGREARLQVFEEPLAGLDPRRAGLVRDIAAEENEDREVVMRRIAETNPDLDGPQGLAAVRTIMAAHYRRTAEPGMRVQLPDGKWTRQGRSP